MRGGKIFWRGAGCLACPAAPGAPLRQAGPPKSADIPLAQREENLTAPRGRAPGRWDDLQTVPRLADANAIWATSFPAAEQQMLRSRAR